MERSASLRKKCGRLLGVILSVAVFSGCATVSIPKYIKDEKPYTRIVYANFDKALDATKQGLKKSGWEVVSSSDPKVFEHSTMNDPKGKEILLFTDIKEIRAVLGTRYARINVYLRSTAQPNETEIEIRYLSISSVGFSELKNYKHPMATNKIFKDIEQIIE